MTYPLRVSINAVCVPPLTGRDRLQPRLYLLAARLEERRQREPLAEVRGVLVRGEPGTVGCDLEEHPAGLAEVDGTEVVAVDLRRHTESRAPYPLPPRRVFLVVRRPKCDVVDAAPSQIRLRRPGPLDDPYLSPRPPRTDLEVDDAPIILDVLPNDTETEHLTENPRRVFQVAYRELHRTEAPDARLPRHRAAFPRDAAGDRRITSVVHQPQPLSLGVGEGDEAPAITLLHAAMLDAELQEPARPELERLPPRDPELRRRDLTGALMVRRNSQVGPIEERDLRPRPPKLVAVEQVVGRDVVLVDRLLYQPQPQNPSVERDVLRSLRRHRRDVMQSAKLHAVTSVLTRKQFRTKLKPCQGRVKIH